MRSVSKTVYYCDYCSRHRLSRTAMEKHEAGCTLNPERVCRWRIDGHSNGSKQMDMAPIADALSGRAKPGPAVVGATVTQLEQADIDWLRDEVDGCPACMLAALRQSGVTDYHYDAESTVIFDYGTEVERLRVEENAVRAEDAW